MYRDPFMDLENQKAEIQRIVVANARAAQAGERMSEARLACAASSATPGRTRGDLGARLGGLLRLGFAGLVRPLGL